MLPDAKTTLEASDLSASITVRAPYSFSPVVASFSPVVAKEI